MFDLMATSEQEDLMLPLDEGVVEVWVTMAPTEKPDMVETDTEYFAVNYIPADGVVAFTIAPASCTLLFPYAVVWGGGLEYRHSHRQSECLYRYSAEWRRHVHPVSERWGDDHALNGRYVILEMVWPRMDLFLRGTPTPCCSAKSWMTQACPVIS